MTPEHTRFFPEFQNEAGGKSHFGRKELGGGGLIFHQNKVDLNILKRSCPERRVATSAIYYLSVKNYGISIGLEPVTTV